ncbi:hypothetical protein GGD81_003110 [Rhodobium orientis]|nr:hypothetical protein [Rhodobium orientis]
MHRSPHVWGNGGFRDPRSPFALLWPDVRQGPVRVKD